MKCFTGELAATSGARVLVTDSFMISCTGDSKQSYMWLSAFSSMILFYVVRKRVVRRSEHVSCRCLTPLCSPIFCCSCFSTSSHFPPWPPLSTPPIVLTLHVPCLSHCFVSSLSLSSTSVHSTFHLLFSSSLPPDPSIFTVAKLDLGAQHKHVLYALLIISIILYTPVLQRGLQGNSAGGIDQAIKG